MAKHPGHVDVTTEVGFCNFCQRTRNLRREEHHLGELVRTIVACETCHRTLSNTIGVARTPEPEPEPAPAPEPEPVVAAAKPARKPAKKAVAKRAPAKRASPAATKTPPKPRSTATRQTSKKK